MSSSRYEYQFGIGNERVWTNWQGNLLGASVVMVDTSRTQGAFLIPGAKSKDF